MFETVLLGLGWFCFFLLAAFFVPPMVIGSFQFWVDFYGKVKTRRKS